MTLVASTADLLPGSPAAAAAYARAALGRLGVRVVAGQRVELAAGVTVILLHPCLPVVGVSIVMERERQQNGRTLVNG